MAEPERSLYEEADLTDSQAIELAGGLAELIRHPSWPAFIELLRGRRIAARELALDGPIENFSKWQGFVEGLKAAEQLPSQVVQRALSLAKRDEANGRRPRVELDLMDAGGDPSGL